MLDRLRRRWPLILAVTLVALITINVCEMSYNDLQTAPDAVAFRHAVTSHARALGATGCDVVFAMGYGLLGLIGLRALGWPTRFARPAAVLVVVSALFDVIENLLVMRNIVAERTLTDGWITAMRVPGTFKWMGSPVLLVMLIALLRRWFQQRRSSGPAESDGAAARF